MGFCFNQGQIAAFLSTCQPKFAHDTLIMKIVVTANTTQQTAFLSKGIPVGVEVCFYGKGETIPEADAYFDFLYEEEGFAFPGITQKPIFVNAVINTTADLPANAIRINGWNGFLERSLIEIAIEKNTPLSQEAASVLQILNWPYLLVPDVPGMIAARVIAMIINEAYFGLGDAISSKADIDTAMKLGTNYPYGPFEWCEKIGIQKIYALLEKLRVENTRYTPASAMEKEMHKP